MRHLLLSVMLVSLWGCPGAQQEDLVSDAGVVVAPIPEAPPVVDPGPQLHPPLEVTGVVIDGDDVPVAEAWVMQGGRSDEKILTAQDGSFTLVLEDPGYGISVLVATKPGYRAIGMEYFMPGEPVTLKIRAVNAPDNELYVSETSSRSFTDSNRNICTPQYKH